ncbi:hypothetical protein CEK26_009301 [Fusarium fujikuroi]|nr:hypothetical protein CEK26_009301 [Fusarium fujikuroi]
MSDDEDIPVAPNAPDSGIRDPSLKSESNSSDLGQSSKRNGTPLDKRRALRSKRKPKDARNTDSDSDDADLTGIKRVTVLPILQLAVRPTPPKSEANRKLEASAPQVASEEQGKGRNLDNVNRSASVETALGTIESQPRGNNKRVSELQSESHEEKLGAAYMSGMPYQVSDGYNGDPYDRIPGPGAYVFGSVLPGGFVSKDPRLECSSTSSAHRPSAPRDKESEKKESAKKRMPKVRRATEEDAKRHKIPAGYSLKKWDPREEPILLLGSVFDANSLGKWIYDWSVYAYKPSTPISDMAGDFWLLLIQLADRLKRAEETIERIESKDSKELVEEYIEAGERFWARLRSLLKRCEAPMLRAYKFDEEDPKNTVNQKGNTDENNNESSQEAKSQSDALNESGETLPSSEGGTIQKTGKTKQDVEKNVGVAFIETIFGKGGELKRTEGLMRNMRLYNLRFDADCEEVLSSIQPYNFF